MANEAKVDRFKYAKIQDSSIQKGGGGEKMNET